RGAASAALPASTRATSRGDPLLPAQPLRHAPVSRELVSRPLRVPPLPARRLSPRSRRVRRVLAQEGGRRGWAGPGEFQATKSEGLGRARGAESLQRGSMEALKMNRFSRNPAYLGDLLVTLGVALLTGAGVSLVAPVLFFLVVNAIVIPVEEQA